MAGIKISTEIVLRTPELAHLYDIVHFLENAPPGSLFPEKQEAVEISIALENAHNLLKAQPTLSLKETLATVISRCPEGFSGEALLKVTDSTIKKWVQLSKHIVSQLENELQLA
jgi:hypothetical protein